MIVTNGKGALSGDASIILDMFDIGPNGSRVIGGNATIARGNHARYQRLGLSGDPENASGNRTMFNFVGDLLTNGYPRADQIVFTNERITVLKGYARCYAAGWTAGFVPSKRTGLVEKVPFWPQITFETTLKKLGTGVNDQTCFGWQAEGNNGPWNTAGGFRNAPMVTLYSPESQGNWTAVVARCEMFNGGAPFVTLPLATPIDATVFRRLKTRITFGPVYSIEFFIDDTLVKSVSAADLPWNNLEVTNQEMNELYPTINPTKDTAANNGVEGPYMSRLTVRMVS